MTIYITKALSGEWLNVMALGVYESASLRTLETTMNWGIVTTTNQGQEGKGNSKVEMKLSQSKASIIVRGKQLKY